MSFRPMLIKEPELRWPIVLLAALITAAIAMLVTVMHFVASTNSPVSRSPARYEWMLQPGQPDFDQFRQQITIEQVVGTEKLQPFNDLAVELTAVVRNETGRTISGLEMRAALLDNADSTLRERTVAVIPVHQTILEINEAINARILLEGIDRDSDRARPVLEVTGITFE